jgi:tetratricopeptide (TPR) repeat protein
MKPWLQLVLAAVVAAVVGFGFELLRDERRPRESAPASDLTELRALASELQAENRELAARLEALPAPGAASGTAARAPVRDLDRAIADYMARQAGAAPSDGSLASPQAAIDAESAAIADRILSGEVEGEDLEHLWQQLREEKRIDAVVSEIERQAALAPNNPDLQSELGKAYLQKLFDVGIGPMAAAWGEKADKAFDRALELDDTHWEARFEKALALSNWPEFLGKRGEAIAQFELLVKQQEDAPRQPRQAWTYFFLGNMYDQAGQHEKAEATWRHGLERFPDDENLLSRTGGER